MPQASIIIRTFNEEKNLGNLLQALRRQNYHDYEIIVVDSGSTDKTLDIARNSVDTVLQIESRDFTFGYSLNLGCRQAKGQYLVFVSAHVIPTSDDWLKNLLAPFADQRVAMVYGRQMGNRDSKLSEQQDLKRIFTDKPSNSKTFLAYANNANAAVRKKLWEEYPFDEYLFGLEDIEWAKYVTGKGFLVHYEPKAAIYHIHTERWPQVFNRYRREAIAAFRIGLPHPPQAEISLFWMVKSLLLDFLASIPNLSPSRLEEILRFRYYQWKGSRQGWYRDRNFDFNRDKYSLFYPVVNRVVSIKNKDQARIEEMPLPEIAPGSVLIKVDYVGVCRTDIEVYDGSLGYYHQGLAKYPIIPGHEFSGTIVKIGANNKFQERFRAGERVVGECILSKGEKTPRAEVGVINYNGAYGQFIVMPGDFIHKIPVGLDQKVASLAEPLAVVLRSKRRLGGRLTPKCDIAVIGAGPIGNFCAQVFSLDGYGVMLFDKSEERLAKINNGAIKTSSVLQDLSRFDVVIDATGSKQVLDHILKTTKIDSTILLLGFPYGFINYNFEDIVGREKVIVGSVGGEWEDFEKALQLLPELNTAPFVEKVLPLDDFLEAWELHHSQKYLKIILKP
jgi:2-desacetyl-2-hydroxyethyl bacteriochlorophyllide A dehydrogenase